MRKIITIGFDIPGYAENYNTYSSSQSLFDADIIIFKPDFSSYSYSEDYQGKPCYSEYESFRLKEDTRHWYTELSTALQYGKTIFIFIGRFEEIFVDTGQKEYSGAGRSARVTKIVTPYNNYEFLPVEIPPLTPKEGTEIIFTNNPIFTTFWTEFRSYLRYESYLDGEIDSPLFFTKTGDKPLGGLFRLGKGNLVLLPAIRYPDSFTKYGKEESYWTDEAVKLGNRLIQVLVDIDSSLRAAVESTPPPDWTSKRVYQFQEEINLQKKVVGISQKIEELTSKKNVLLDNLQQVVLLRNLLFEKGKPLENAIIEALQILGFKAENYEDVDLEIDQIIVSPEGNRFIGEAEGKDNGAVNIDKFRQLESNIQEDFQREEIAEPSTGILFGNGFRLIDPETRNEQFTEKCIKNAKRLNAILIRTVDLFEIVKYIKENDDKKFAQECRDAIMESKGKIVKFPKIKYSKYREKDKPTPSP